MLDKLKKYFILIVISKYLIFCFYLWHLQENELHNIKNRSSVISFMLKHHHIPNQQLSLMIIKKTKPLLLNIDMIKCLIKHTYTLMTNWLHGPSHWSSLVSICLNFSIQNKYLLFKIKRDQCKAVNVTKKCYNCTVGNLEIKNDKKKKTNFYS